MRPLTDGEHQALHLALRRINATAAMHDLLYNIARISGYEHACATLRGWGAEVAE